MPSWKIHRCWEKILLGKDYGFIDEWIDSENKEIKIELVRQALMECGHDSYNISSMYKAYKQIYKTYRLSEGTSGFNAESLDKVFVAEIIKSLRGHDSWRIKPEYMCTTLTYIYHVFGLEGLSVTILHMLLDEIAKLKYANTNVIREHLKGFINEVINSLPRRDMRVIAKNILDSVLANLEEILQSILVDKGVKSELSNKIKKLTILYDPSSITKRNRNMIKRIVELARTENIEIKLVNVQSIGCSEARDYYWLVREISILAKIGLKPRRKTDKKLMDMQRCTLVIEGGLLVIIEYDDGSLAFYPHYTTMAGSTKYVPVDELINQLS